MVAESYHNAGGGAKKMGGDYLHFRVIAAHLCYEGRSGAVRHHVRASIAETAD
jgi:hypothetical protein